MRTFTALIAVVSLLVFTGIAHAVVLTTAPALDSFVGTDGVTCTIANVGAAAASVRIYIYDYSGSIVTSTPSISLGAGRVTGLFDLGAGAYCQFVSNKTTVRAAAIYRDSSSNLGMAILAR